MEALTDATALQGVQLPGDGDYKMDRKQTITVLRTFVRCAFCRGTGRDPFDIMSPLSTCCVCGGRGTVSIETPCVRCAFCHGTGVYPRSRQTCTACSGVGVSPVKEPHKTCPHCLGTGTAPHSEGVFYCLTCHGTGIIEEGS